MKKILLGGIPLGCDNIGDEAIIDCVCSILNKHFPDDEIYVMTNDTESAQYRPKRKLAPLYGFNDNYLAKDFGEFVKDFDCYVWAGATGLSDYPHVAVEMLKEAHRVNVPVIIFNVGMNDKLNPAFFQLKDGKKFQLLSFAGRLTGDKNRFVKFYENKKIANMKAKINAVLSKAKLIIVRDFESAKELEKCHVSNVQVGADTAILQPSREQNQLKKDEKLKTIGLCVSAQSQITQIDELINMLNDLLAYDNYRCAFIPMNLKTDALLLHDIASRLIHPEKVTVVDKSEDPGVIQDIASKCDVVVSSRLHLLILSSNVYTPIIGISRGSKVDNFLGNYNLSAQGDVNECNFVLLKNEILRLIKEKDEFSITAKAVHEDLLIRLKNVENLLVETINNL